MVIRDAIAGSLRICRRSSGEERERARCPQKTFRRRSQAPWNRVSVSKVHALSVCQVELSLKHFRLSIRALTTECSSPTYLRQMSRSIPICDSVSTICLYQLAGRMVNTNYSLTTIFHHFTAAEAALRPVRKTNIDITLFE